MTKIDRLQNKDIHDFDINNAGRASIKDAVKKGIIQTNGLSIDQRKDLIEDYLIEQGHSVFGECDDINYLEHLIKQPLSIDLKKLVGQQLAEITIKNYDANIQLTKRSSRQIESLEQQIDKQNKANQSITSDIQKRRSKTSQTNQENSDFTTLLKKPKRSLSERIKMPIKSAIESIKNNKGAILPALSAISFGVIVAGLVVAFATTLPIFAGITVACIGAATMISSLSATITTLL